MVLLCLLCCNIYFTVCIRNDHYPVCRLDIRQDSEFATGYGYPERLSPPKPPRGHGTMWQNFSLLFNAMDSENSLSYAISCQACKICQSFCL